MFNSDNHFSVPNENKGCFESYACCSPLRYPGGKTRAVNSIVQFFPKNLKELVSPFFGGGSAELKLASQGVKVYGYDIFTPLVEFWQSLLEEPQELVAEVEKYFPLSKERFYHLQRTQCQLASKIERAAVFFVLNRASFSGSTLSGGMSPGHPRFTKKSILELKHFYNPNIIIQEADFHVSLPKHPDIFAYLDPPYLIKNALYGYKGNTHRNFDHEGLAKILRARNNWILSYNDCQEIRSLYKEYKMVRPVWNYGMSSDKNSRELLILSQDLAIDSENSLTGMIS